MPSTSQPTRNVWIELFGNGFEPRKARKMPGTPQRASGYATEREARKTTATATHSPIASCGRRSVGNATSGPIRAAPPSPIRAL
jgi:hypothetical protein